MGGAQALRQGMDGQAGNGGLEVCMNRCRKMRIAVLDDGPSVAGGWVVSRSGKCEAGMRTGAWAAVVSVR